MFPSGVRQDGGEDSVIDETDGDTSLRTLWTWRIIKMEFEKPEPSDSDYLRDLSAKGVYQP